MWSARTAVWRRLCWQTGRRGRRHLSGLRQSRKTSALVRQQRVLKAGFLLVKRWQNDWQMWLQNCGRSPFQGGRPSIFLAFGLACGKIESFIEMHKDSFECFDQVLGVVFAMTVGTSMRDPLTFEASQTLNQSSLL